SFRYAPTGVSRSPRISRHTGTSVCSRARRRNSSREGEYSAPGIGGQSRRAPGRVQPLTLGHVVAAENADEAGPLAGVARGPGRVDEDQEGVGVAIETHLQDA